MQACIRRWHPFASCSCPGLHSTMLGLTKLFACFIWPAPTSMSFVSMWPLPGSGSHSSATVSLNDCPSLRRRIGCPLDGRQRSARRTCLGSAHGKMRSSCPTLRVQDGSESGAEEEATATATAAPTTWQEEASFAPGTCLRRRSGPLVPRPVLPRPCACARSGLLYRLHSATEYTGYI